MAMMSGSEEDLNNTDMWPSLNEAHGVVGLGSSIGSDEISNRKEDDSWEVISQQGGNVDDDGTRDSKKDRNSDIGDSLVLVEDDNDNVQPQYYGRMRRNPKSLRHSASSPDLTSYGAMTQSQEDDDDAVKHDDDDENNNVMSVDLSSYEAEDDSHVVVSSPEEPVFVDANEHADADDDDDNKSLTMSHVMVSSSVALRQIQSFRDAILSETPTLDGKSTKQRLEQEKHQQRILFFKQQQQQQQKTKVKPKFVVVAPPPLIRGRSLSTGDLQSLIIKEEEDGGEGGGGWGGGDDDNILGESDAMEYYHQKSKGHVGRKNLFKSRPDEMKRKEMSLLKKDLQRKQQQQQQQNK